MAKALKVILTVFIVFLVAALGLLYVYGPNFNIYLFPPSPQKYTEQALNKMNQGIFATGDTWKSAKEQAFLSVKDAQSYEECHDAIQEALSVAGGKHASFNTPSQISDESSKNTLPDIKQDGEILYIKLPPLIYGEKDFLDQYANTINEALLAQNYQGVIIDLQENTGGDMGPMILGLSSLLEDGTLLSFVDKFDNLTPVNLENGNINAGSNPRLKTLTKVKPVPVAVLINEHTASSAEITALALKTITKVKFFGTPSASYTSVNSQFPLYDGSIIQLTTGKLKDAQGKIWLNEAIKPDLETQNAYQDAKEWILQAQH